MLRPFPLVVGKGFDSAPSQRFGLFLSFFSPLVSGYLETCDAALFLTKSDDGTVTTFGTFLPFSEQGIILTVRL